MLQQILLHTPVYVWAILAFLVYRGVKAAADRDVPIYSIVIIPVVMFILSLQGIQSGFGMSGLAPWVWIGGIAVGLTLTWRLLDARKIVAQPERGVITQRGSWLPLALMMAIFCTKYVVAVMLAIQPGLKNEMAFTAAVCILYGLFNGVFIGRLLRNVAAYRQARQAVVPARPIGPIPHQA